MFLNVEINVLKLSKRLFVKNEGRHYMFDSLNAFSFLACIFSEGSNEEIIAFDHIIQLFEFFSDSGHSTNL